jgi:predicted SprT family Zn-dependent metalloprotease
MVIPRKITLAGIEVEIVREPGFMQKAGATGMACYEEQKIYIDPEVPGLDMLKQTFVHEAVHFILYVMGRQELRQNEEFVDGFAHLAYQIIKECTDGKKDDRGHTGDGDQGNTLSCES